MYAILDIETTGGQFNEEGITEIAIYKFDGLEITDQFISLVNPEIPIQPFVVKLTGISNAMLQSAPKFFEVAKRIIEITKDCILVAHNASFDYRILRTEFRRLGYNFEAHTLCTVELAQKLLPEQPSHSLGKLVRALGIPMADRHRASGDAMATVRLFKLLLSKDTEKTIVKELVKSVVEKGIAPRLLDIVDSLPSKTGIYYIHKEDGTILFIGRSRNIRKQVNQHFIGESFRSKKIQAEVFAVTFEETGTELIAQLKEQQEIYINKPALSRPSKKSAFPWSIYLESANDGYNRLVVQKTDRKKQEIIAVGSLAEAKNLILQWIAEYNLLHEYILLPNPGSSEPVSILSCDADEYNNRVSEMIANVSFANRNLMLTDRGRTIGERSAFLIENGIFKGYAYYDLNYQITNIEILKSILIPMADSRDTRNTIQAHIRKNKGVKIISF